MALNKVTGNMYAFLNDYPEKGSNRGYTWNTCKGLCPHMCQYCFMRRFGEQPELHFDKKELKTDLGQGNFIFVGSSCDIFASNIPEEWIIKTLHHCRKFRTNRYLFQSKNPERMFVTRRFPINYIVGTTIETNRRYSQMGATPLPEVRAGYMNKISKQCKTMVTIEPIMDFDLTELVDLIKQCNPEWVNIGADSQGHNLPEPSYDKIEELIIHLGRFTEVKLKKNLERIRHLI